MTQGPDPVSAARAAQAPPAVADLAAEWRLGELRTSRTDMGPSVVATYALAVAAASVAVGAVGAVTELRPLVIAAVCGVVLALVALAVAAKTVLTGRRECYAYTNGFVCRANRRLRAVPWSAVSSVEPQPADRPTPLGYKVRLTDGTKVFVPVGTLREEWRVFGDEFWQVASAAGVPIAD